MISRTMTSAQVQALFDKVCNWGRWGADDA